MSQVTRTALQENLFRAILHKIANERYFVATDWQVLNAVVRAVSVDSDFSNAQLEHLALQPGRPEGQGRDVSIDAQALNGSPTSG